MSDKEVSGGIGGVRNRYRDLEPANTDENNKAYAQYISAAPAVPLGHFEGTATSTPKDLPTLTGSPIPADAKRVVLYANDPTNGFTYTDDGTNPSATHGMMIPAGVNFIYDTDPDSNFKVWAVADVEIRLAYYG